MRILPAYVTAPVHVTAADLGPVLVLVDYRSGAVRCLLPPAGAWWRRTAETGHLDVADQLGLAGQLIDAGLLLPTMRPLPWSAPVTAPAVSASWGSTEHPAGLVPPSVPATVILRATATAALGVVLAVKCTGPTGTAMRRVMALVRLCAARARRPATVGQIESTVNAVRYAAYAAPTRAACLEESAAVVVMLAAQGLGVTWCHGIAPDPVRLHAWVQTGYGFPVAEPASTGAYPLLTMISGGDRP